MRKILAAAGALSAAAVIAGSSLPAASAATSHASAKMESFRLVSGVISGRGSVIATGAFTAGGRTNLNTRVGVLHFPGGTVTAFPRPTSTVTQISRRTCLMTIVQQGTYRLGRGTGKFARLSGHGRFAAHILAVLRRTKQGRCSQSRPPQALQQVINAHGPVSGI
jgi:hypothetical protein